jgi:predicted molibdopterin-dependent oxidoreductase YjgC
MTGTFFWQDEEVPFRDGESVAFALLRHGTGEFGKSPVGRPYSMFCGIGACQGCLVFVEGRGVVIACQTPARQGLGVQPCVGFGVLEDGESHDG